ncbi:MAG: polysaccharide biosynthesis tyrosine autokinase [Dolichospermum sp. LBC05a]|nr:polysaccharide biosynthesis tyrosine autokinase [Dolichospermum sp. OL01]MCO5796830.1 polysaccharide biosynthesis tyrosine autokinase [Dolichospermum sp. OL03]MCS6281301.1 polysaccharide biosynthesis tyrosine autokinase [Dolichospermum sp.]QSV58408.1 MAG: polysaccharide biosynthesis tyrosine autokinase [Dolichospermum sp. LBC05a]
MLINQEDQDSSIDIQQYWLILKRRWLVSSIVVASVFGVTVFATYTQKPVYESEGKLVFTKKDAASALSSVSEKVGELGGLTNLSNPVDTEAEVIRSYPIIIQTITNLKLTNDQGEQLTLESFLRKLKLKTIRGTDVMELSYKSTNPQEATEVVNSLMKYYLESNIRTNRTEARSAREFLSKQLPEVENRVTKAEINLRRFKEYNRVVALDVEAQTGLQSLGRLDEAITQSKGELAAAYTRSVAIQDNMKLSTQQAVDLSTLSQSPGVQQVLTEYQKVQSDLATMRSAYTDDNPKVVDLAMKAAALKSQLEERVAQTIGSSESIAQQNLQIGSLKQALTQDLVKSEVERLALTNQIGELQRVFIFNRRRLDSLPRLEQQQLQLQRQLSVAQITYQELLKQFQVVQILENQNVGNARIISPALIPESPVSPKIPLNLALGGFLGILLGAGTALLLESMNQSLKNIEEANRLLGFPLLGTIPQYGENPKNQEESRRDLPLLNSPYAPVSTSFEMLQTNLGFTLSDKELRVIVITSATAGEGKSFIAANLALAAASVGRRVLLVDADMRRPRQHRIWEVNNLLGVSNILAGQTQFKNTAQAVSSQVDMLPAGKIPPNPVTLLDSQRMADLVEQASQDYDFVIIDSPPLTAVTDPLIIGKYVDGLLLVVRPGEVQYSAVSAAKLLLNQAKVPILGMVVNGISEESGYGGYYYYRSYYGTKGGGQEANVQ